VKPDRSATRREPTLPGPQAATGSVNDIDLEISGSGRHLADGMTSKTVKARISGSGTASLAAMDGLDLKISGSGS
jgi:hypothetical protein